jgi:uncharacterized protein (DUF488 family)
MSKLFTIGYQGADPDRLVEALAAEGVLLVADVRAVALSRKRGFSKNKLHDRLAESAIGYRHLIDLGHAESRPRGRPRRRRRDDASDLLRAAATAGAQTAFEELATLAASAPVCLLCFERDPALCHRTVLAERLAERGFSTVDLAVV